MPFCIKLRSAWVAKCQKLSKHLSLYTFFKVSDMSATFKKITELLPRTVKCLTDTLWHSNNKCRWCLTYNGLPNLFKILNLDLFMAY